MRPLSILFVTPYVPSRLRPRPFNFIVQLAQRGHRVSLLAACTNPLERPLVDQIRPYCDAVRIVDVSFWQSMGNCARGVASDIPLQALYCRSQRLEEEVRALIRRGGFDVLHLEHLRSAIPGLRAPAMPTVFDSVDCISQLLSETLRHGTSVASRLTAGLEIRRTRRFERLLVERFSRILVTSDAERASLLELATRDTGEAGQAATNGRIEVIPNGVDCDHFRPGDEPADPHRIVFVGRLGYHANRAAALYLIRDIMPRVWQREPRTRLAIVGADPPAALRKAVAPAADRITITDYVDDIRPHLNRARIAVAPLPYGVGIQNKVLEAMATATPVVASPTACFALPVSDGEEVLVGDGAGPFADRVLELLASPELCDRIGRAGRRYVEKNHSWQEATGRLETLYQQEVEPEAEDR